MFANKYLDSTANANLLSELFLQISKYTKINGVLPASAAVPDIAKLGRGWVAGALKVQLLVHRLRLPQKNLFCSALKTRSLPGGGGARL